MLITINTDILNKIYKFITKKNVTANISGIWLRCSDQSLYATDGKVLSHINSACSIEDPCYDWVFLKNKIIEHILVVPKLKSMRIAIITITDNKIAVGDGQGSIFIQEDYDSSQTPPPFDNVFPKQAVEVRKRGRPPKNHNFVKICLDPELLANLTKAIDKPHQAILEFDPTDQRKPIIVNDDHLIMPIAT